MIGQRWRTGRWVVVALLAIAAFAAMTAWITGPQKGARMDADATSPRGAHALVTLLRERGVDVVVADTVDDVERAAGPDSTILFATTENTRGDALWSRLAAVPGNRLVVEPTVAAREALAPGIRQSKGGQPDGEPGCDLREATRAGAVKIDNSETFEHSGDTAVTRCYGGALVRYRDGDRTVTVAGTADFMTNGGLPREGNAALAMNLGGDSQRLIWYSPQRLQGDRSAEATIGDLIPRSVIWVVAQLCLVVAMLAVWQGRRLGPLVAEKLPVVVRASETVEGRARLYRSRRARDRAAAALRSAALQRVTPRLGLGPSASDEAIVAAVALRYRGDGSAVHRILFGPAPDSDDDLFNLAQALDDIERQVSHS
ncbi:MAG: DUF4350 domain-containing protein [Mycobacterium sp.]